MALYYNKMRIVFITDTHVLFKNPDNRTDLVKESMEIFYWLDSKYEELKYDAIFHGGDLMDRGYKQVKQEDLLSFLTILKRLKDKTDGEMYINIGNHELNFPKDNLFFSIVDVISNPLKERLFTNFNNAKEILEPIFKAPTSLEVGNVVFKFLGFDREKNYKISKEGVEDKFVVGLYHDDLVSFESAENLYHHKTGHGLALKNTDIMENVNIALCGHIHIPLEDMVLDNKRQTLIITPGSPISRTTSEIHSSIKIPIIDINTDTGEFNIIYETYELPNQENSFIKEVVQENKKKYELAKIIQNDKTIAKGKNGMFESLLDSIEDIEIRSILIESLEIDTLNLADKLQEIEKAYFNLI